MKDYHLNDSPFFRLMGAIGDLVVLNILWLLCCLPVVRAGGSTRVLCAPVPTVAGGGGDLAGCGRLHTRGTGGE